MSRKRESVKPVESESESGEDDDASSEEKSDSEPEQTPQKSSAKPQQMPAPPSSSEEEEESGSETESESDEPKPVASKPIDEPQKSSKGAMNSRLKPHASLPATPTKSAAAKRSAAEDVSMPAKKKKTNDPETSEKKSSAFQRLFTEDDEIVILQGMIDYKSETNSDPAADFAAFYEYIKKKLHTDISRHQLQTKIKRLKKKFVTNNGKEKEGKPRTFANHHEQKSYDLSKVLWENGKENGAGRKTSSKKGKANETATASGEVKHVKDVVVVGEATKLNFDGGASVEEIMLKIGRKIGIEGEEEWQNLKVEELELYIKQLEVRTAQAKLVLAMIKSQHH